MNYSLQARTTSGRIVRLALAVVIFTILFTGLLSLMGLRIPILTTFITAMLALIQLLIYASPVLLFFALRGRGKAPDTQKEADGKPKRGESLGDLMSILNHEDIEDLRARVKARLEEQIDSADADEMETFADLLDDQKQKRK